MTIQGCEIQPVAVVGAGTIGAGWATLFAGSGCEVRVFDEVQDCLTRSSELITDWIKFLCDSGLAGVDVAEDAVANVRICQSLEEALQGAKFVQESIIEDYGAKEDLYRRMEELLDGDAVIASSTSGLLVSRLQAGRQHPERFIIGHPWNPPYLVPLVEIVPGPLTSFSTTDRTSRFYKSLGMDAILVRKEVPGHVGNRLAAALWREAIDLVNRGIATVEDVDRAVRSGPGLRWALMGVHLTYHLGGGPEGIEHFIDHLKPAFESWWADIATWETLPEDAKEKLVAGMRSVVGDSSYSDLVERRDALLVELLGLNENRLHRNPIEEQRLIGTHSQVV